MPTSVLSPQTFPSEKLPTLAGESKSKQGKSFLLKAHLEETSGKVGIFKSVVH